MMKTSRMTLVAVGIAFAFGFAAPANAQIDGGGFDKALYDRFVSMRTGDGEPVYWYSVGTLRAYPSGETLAIMEGFDTARHARRPDAPNTTFQLSRKTYIFRDPVTGDRITEIDGKPVVPIQYPYQLIEYTFETDRLVTMVEQGREPNVQRIGPGTDVSARWLGNGVAQYTAPLYLDFPLPGGGNYQAFENYDFFIQPDAVERDARYQLSWVRYGTSPPFNNGEPVIMHMVAWRTDSFDDLPDTIKSYVREEAPLWLAPPSDFADIESLQAPQESKR